MAPAHDIDPETLLCEFFKLVLSSPAASEGGEHSRKKNLKKLELDLYRYNKSFSVELQNEDLGRSMGHPNCGIDSKDPDEIDSDEILVVHETADRNSENSSKDVSEEGVELDETNEEEEKSAKDQVKKENKKNVKKR